MRTRLMAAAAVLAATLAGGACVAGFVVPVGPPPARVEVRGARPGPYHVWIAGHWSWRGQWVWMRGEWRVPPHRGDVWAPGRWVHRGRGWVWKEGRWRRHRE